jgi:tripartite-type tricarboxylate transporter receptor subunit TctC
METVVKKPGASLALFTALFAGSIGTAAADWPSDRPIEIMVGFAPGGTTDVMARTLAPFISKHLGGKASMLIVNRPGASGEIAVSQIQRAKPDGYTIGIINQPGYFFLPIYRKVSYDPKQISLVARIVSDPTILVATKRSKHHDLATVIRDLKADPSSLSAGHNGVGTNGHIAMVRLEAASGAKVNAIPFNGTAQQKLALSGDQINFAFISASEVPDPEKEAVPARILAQFSKSRISKLSSVPTTFEQGFPVEMTAERGFAAPAGVNPAILASLQKAIEMAMKDPEYIRAAHADAPFLDYLGGAEWTAQMESQRKAYEEVVETVRKNEQR